MSEDESISIRDALSFEERNYEPRHGIDPGFLNYRRLYPFIPEVMRREIDRRVAGTHANAPDHFRQLATDHHYTSTALFVARQRGARTAVELVASPSVAPGAVVSSTDIVLGNDSVRSEARVELEIELQVEADRKVYLRFSPNKIVADTTRMELSQRDTISYVGIVEEVDSERIVIAPLIMGAPWLHPGPSGDPGFDMMWSHYDFFENFVEDVDEFSAVRAVPRAEASDDWKVLKGIPEKEVKAAICQILGDRPIKDWGGEHSDHFSTSLHLSGRRVSAAFLLKGPAEFSEMKARHLGRNGDQIYRLSQEPAELLVLQHSHLVSPAVRATLRAFAVNPASPRRYLVLDGPDTYRLLVAHGRLAPGEEPS